MLAKHFVIVFVIGLGLLLSACKDYTVNGKTYTVPTKDTIKPVFVSASTIEIEEGTATVRLLARDETSAVTYWINGGDSKAFDLNAQTGVLIFYTKPDYESGKTTYTFLATVTDTSNNAATQDVTIKILNVDETRPTANPQYMVTYENEDINITLTANDSDNNKGLTYSLVSQPLHGKLKGSAPKFIYTPDTDYTGKDSFTFKVNDGYYDSNIASVDILILSKNVSDSLPIKKTGQTKSYNVNGYVVTDGSLKDDGYYQKGITPQYTRFSDMVVDEITGLMWQDNEDVNSSKKPWLIEENYNTCRNDTNSSACYDTIGDTAATYCSKLILGGYDDWRLPTTRELESIVNYGKAKGTMDEIYFIYNQPAFYWSSTTGGYNESEAWVVNFNYGFVKFRFKNEANFIRCVRNDN